MNPLGDSAEDTGAVLAPRRRHDAAFDFRAFRAKEERRLVDLIHEAHRDEQKACTKIQLLGMQVIDGQEFGRDRTAAARTPMFKLKLRVKNPLLVVLVSDIENSSQSIKDVILVLIVLVVEAAQSHLTVTTDREARFALIDLGGRRAETTKGLQGHLFRHGKDRFKSSHFVGQRFDLGFDGLESLILFHGFRLLCVARGRGRHSQQGPESDPARPVKNSQSSAHFRLRCFDHELKTIFN